MKKKSLILTSVILLSAGGLQAQVVNRALSFSENGKVDCGAMPDFDNLSSYSLQFWMSPDKWQEGATLLSRGNDFSVKLGQSGNILFNNGSNSVSASSSDLKSGEWNQVTLICDNGSATILVNGEEAGTGNLASTGKSENSFVLGGGYAGVLDEVRVWNAALDNQMKTFDYFTNNTLNKWCPMWDNLVVYYKMDQENCPNLVDYKGIENSGKNYDNHGILSGGVSRVVAGNDKMPYLINSAYTNNERFFDRTIPRDQYLLANDLIILGADVFASDGHIETKTPNYHATVEGAQYLENYEGRDGVLAFDGKSSTRLVAPAATLNNGGNYGFETWLYLDEWTPGALLFRKESEDGKNGLSLRLGDDSSNPTLIVRINGNDYVSQSMDIQVGKWVHVGVAPGTGGSVIRAIMFYLNDKSIRPDVAASTTETDVTPIGNDDLPIYVGEGLKGKMDETLFWNKNISLTQATTHMSNVQVPSINKNGNIEEMSNCAAYYKYDKSENPGFSYYSQDAWLDTMKGAYEGHAGINYYISVQGYYSAREPYGNWRDILADPVKRARFVSDLAEISKSYDGVELDLEWIENATQWTNYGKLCQEIEAGLPEGKKFRISLHNSYTAFPKDLRGEFDGFTFQQYGPQANHFGYKNFTNNVNNFLNLGYDPKKIMTSYSTTTSNGTKGSDATGVRLGALAEYVPASVEERDVDKWTSSSDTYSFMGPIQVYERAKYTREKNLQGIFYWDMGNDYWLGTPAAPEMPEYNLAKYCSYGINANNDTIVTNLKVNHYNGSGAVNRLETEASNKGIFVTPNPAESEINVILANGETPKLVEIYSVSGKQLAVRRNLNKVEVDNLPSGLYLLKAYDSKGAGYDAKIVKK